MLGKKKPWYQHFKRVFLTLADCKGNSEADKIFTPWQHYLNVVCFNG